MSLPFAAHLSKLMHSIDTSYTASNLIYKKDHGEWVITGGTLVKQYRDPFGSLHVYLDDGVGQSELFFLSSVEHKYKDVLQQAKSILVRGRVCYNQSPSDHPEYSPIYFVVVSALVSFDEER